MIQNKWLAISFTYFTDVESVQVAQEQSPHDIDEDEFMKSHKNYII